MKILKNIRPIKAIFSDMEYLILLLFSLCVYLPLINGYFIQDEWQLFSVFNSLNNQSFQNIFLSFITPQPGQYVPITQAITYTLFYFFRLDYVPFFIVGLLLHFVVGILLWKFLMMLTNNRVLSLLGAIFFLVTPSHFQATSWVIANIGYSSSAILFILGLIFYFKWLSDDKAQTSIYSSICLLLSLLAKEITIFVFIALPLVTYVWEKDFRKCVKTVFIVLPVLSFGLWNYWFIKTHPLKDLNVQSSINFLNILSLPIRSITQSFIPQDIIYFISRILISIASPIAKLQPNTTLFELTVETIGAMITIGLFSLVLIFIGVYMLRANNKHDTKIFKLYTTGIILAAFSGLPFIFVDPTQFTLLQPRYTYIGALSAPLAVASVMLLTIKRWPRLSILTLIFILFIFALITFETSNKLALVGSIRKNILMSIDVSVPANQTVTLIFITSDSSYYGLPSETHIVPFQNGFGKTLSVYLNPKIHIPQGLYNQDTLWELTSQGYYKDNIGGFGYFRDFGLLQKALKDNSIPKADVYAFYWHGNENKLENISKSTRSLLQ